MPREPRQCVFATRAECVAQCRALTLWARQQRLIGRDILACSVDVFADGAVGHWVEDWMLPAQGQVVDVRGTPVTIDLRGAREPAKELVTVDERGTRELMVTVRQRSTDDVEPVTKQHTAR